MDRKLSNIVTQYLEESDTIQLFSTCMQLFDIAAIRTINIRKAQNLKHSLKHKFQGCHITYLAGCNKIGINNELRFSGLSFDLNSMQPIDFQTNDTKYYELANDIENVTLVIWKGKIVRLRFSPITCTDLGYGLGISANITLCIDKIVFKRIQH